MNHIYETLKLSDKERSRLKNGVVRMFGLHKLSEAIYEATDGGTDGYRKDGSCRVETRHMYAVQISFASEKPIILAETYDVPKSEVYYSELATVPIYFWEVVNYVTGIIKSSGITLVKSEVPHNAAVVTLCPMEYKPLEKEVAAYFALATEIEEVKIVTEIVSTTETVAIPEMKMEHFYFHFGKAEQYPFPLLEFMYIAEFDGELASDVHAFCNEFELQERINFSHKEFSRWQQLSNRLHWLNEKVNKKVDLSF